MGYIIDPKADNCYPGTAILINKFDIRDEAKLNEVETVLVSARSAEWLTAPAVNTLTLPTIKRSIGFYSPTCTIGANTGGEHQQKRNGLLPRGEYRAAGIADLPAAERAKLLERTPTQ